MGDFGKYFEKAAPGDGYFNYCLWPYEPVVPTEGKERGVNLLLNSFEAGGMDERAWEMMQGIRREIGMFKTVWGVKLYNGKLGWEYYFYDYKRQDREVSLSRVIGAMGPWVKSDIFVNERLPYFMFSLDVSNSRVRGEAAMDEAHVYIGNPGSRVSSGISYLAKGGGMTLENFYFFFDARRDGAEVEAKARCSAQVDGLEVDIDEILWPEVRNCRTICIANKSRSDTAYFAGVTVDQLLWFLSRMGYPAEIIGYVREHRGGLDHLLFDVGYDYVGDGDGIRVIKSGFYGIF